MKCIQEQQAIITDQDTKIGQLVEMIANAESTMNLLTEMFTESQQTVAALTARVEALEAK
jgi:septal ring factor EnvC (AmiA/AmiB activator)